MIKNKRKFLFLLLIVSLGFTTFAQDKDEKKPVKKSKIREAIERPVDPKYANKIFSIGTSFGIIADMGQAGSTISASGSMPINSAALPSLVGITKVIMSSTELATIWHSSQQTNAVPLQTLSNFKGGGALVGADFGINGMFDFIPFGIPLYIRLGFDFAKSITGGQNKWTLGPGPDLAAAASLYPIPDGGFEGGQMKVQFDSLYFDGQLSFGAIWGVPGKGKVYAGLGLSYMYGNLSFLIDSDARYTAFLTSIDKHPELMINEAIKEDVKFVTHGISGNMELGTEVTVWGPLSFFAEYYASGAMLLEYAKEEFSDNGKKVFTAVLGGPQAAGFDSQYMERLATPVVLGGTTVKLGLKVYVY